MPLDEFYVLTKYLDARAEGTPLEHYAMNNAIKAIGASEYVLKRAGGKLRSLEIVLGNPLERLRGIDRLPDYETVTWTLGEFTEISWGWSAWRRCMGGVLTLRDLKCLTDLGYCIESVCGLSVYELDLSRYSFHCLKGCAITRHLR